MHRVSEKRTRKGQSGTMSWANRPRNAERETFKRYAAQSTKLSPMTLGATTAALGAMTYAVYYAGRRAASHSNEPQAAHTTHDSLMDDRLAGHSPGIAQVKSAPNPTTTQSTPFLSSLASRGTVSAENVPAFMLANSGLDNEQKLQVALCRRQSWLRAFQCGPMFALWSYAGCVLVEAARPGRLPRGTRQAVPLAAAVCGMTVGAYVGGNEGKPMMNAALAARQVEGAHLHRSERPPEEDAMVAFIRAGTAARETTTSPTLDAPMRR